MCLSESSTVGRRPTNNLTGGGSRRSGRWKSGAVSRNRRLLQQQQDKSPGFSAEEMNSFRQVFEFYDVDNTKTIDLR